MVEDGVLRAMAQTGTSARTTVDILTFTIGRKYLLDARFFPGEKVVYSVHDDTTDQTTEIVARTVITTNLPVENAYNRLFHLRVIEQEAVTKTMFVEFVEFMQKRHI